MDETPRLDALPTSETEENIDLPIFRAVSSRRTPPLLAKELRSSKTDKNPCPNALSISETVENIDFLIF